MEIKIFENAEFGSVRTADINGVTYFIGKDVCEMFGDKNHNRSLGRIDSEDKTKIGVVDSLGRKQFVIAVNESGLYSLLFAMQPQKANNDGVSDAYPIEVQERIEKLHRFKRWVTSEVLPSIRKTFTELEKISFKGNIDGIVYSKNGIPITTSRIISEITNKSHNLILRDIREEISKLNEIDSPNLDSDIKEIINDFKEVEYIATNGQVYKEYELGEMATMQLMLKYSTEYRAKFIICFSKMKKSIMNMFKANVIESVLPQDNRDRQYIYVIKNPENDRVKIGVSNNVEKRLKTLETGAGTKLDLVYQSIICSNAFDIENTVHKHFQEYRVFGEWFEIDVNKVINYLEKQEYILKSEFLKYVSII